MKISRANHSTSAMKYLCFILLVSTVYTAPVDDEKPTVVPAKDDVAVRKVTTKPPEVVEILDSGSEHQIDGSYSFHYRGADGSFREETAVVKNPGTSHEYLEVTGAYSFFDSDGKEVVVHYTAGDRGFVPVGNNIPEVISVAAKENSELPAMDEFGDEDDAEQEVSKATKKNAN